MGGKKFRRESGSGHPAGVRNVGAVGILSVGSDLRLFLGKTG
jgi:hypothetical protein